MIKVTFEFASEFEVANFLAQKFNAAAPAVDNAHVDPGAEQFSEPGKRKRRTKAEMAADLAAAQNAAVPGVTEVNSAATPTDAEFEDEPATSAAASDFLDDDAPPSTPVVTKDDVRAALVAYQERLTGPGKQELETARATVLALLKKVCGADKLGACPEDKFAAVIAAAKKA